MARKRTLLVLAVAAAAAAAFAATARSSSKEARGDTVTPIQHVVVIFGENISFDHYFGTYPDAANTDGQPFHALGGTPTVNGLQGLLTGNPNGADPMRLDSSPTGITGSPGGQLTCDQDHNYTDEQTAFDRGKMDKFISSLGNGSSNPPFPGITCTKAQVMDYYDGNTVTALWNYAQHFAMSDNSFSTTFGPSSPGAINLVSGDTGGVDTSHEAGTVTVGPNKDLISDGSATGFSLTSDAQPYWDDCSTRDAVAMSGQNIGDLLNAAGISWGWFQGGFHPTTSFADAANATPGHGGQSTAAFIPDEFKNGGFNASVPHSSNQGICNAVTPVGAAFGGNGQYGYKDDYIPHHEPFQYYASTANPHHLPPASLSAIGSDTQSYDKNGVPQFDTANHNYDMSDFDALVSAISNGDLPPAALPAVSFLKAPGYQDGHAAYSDPADEQAFVVREINALERTPDWPHTAVIIAYDDSDGWYDHAFPGVQNPSNTVADVQCGSGTPLAGQQGRCGFGPRQPLLVISPFAKENAVDHNLSNQASIINFVEYNWRLPSIAGSADQIESGVDATEHVPFDLAGLFDFKGPRDRRLILDPASGQPTKG